MAEILIIDDDQEICDTLTSLASRQSHTCRSAGTLMQGRAAASQHPFDIVFLDVNDIVLRFEIVKHNRVIYRTDDFDSGAMFSLTLRQYTDFLPYLKVQREALKKRILHGQC